MARSHLHAPSTFGIGAVNLSPETGDTFLWDTSSSQRLRNIQKRGGRRLYLEVLNTWPRSRKSPKIYGPSKQQEAVTPAQQRPRNVFPSEI